MTFTLLSLTELLATIDDQIACPASHVTNPLCAYATVVAQRDPLVLAALTRADLNIADGMGIVWACRLQGCRKVQQIPGPDLLGILARWGQSRDVTHAFVGATPSTLPRLVDRLKIDAPKIRVVGSYAPPFRQVTRLGVLEDLSRLPETPDVVWVGIGTPKQQLWADYAKTLLEGVIFITVGAAFDYVAGLRRRAPKWLRQMSLEWAFNAVSEPTRMAHRELVDNAVFGWSVFRVLLSRSNVVRSGTSARDGWAGPGRSHNDRAMRPFQSKRVHAG